MPDEIVKRLRRFQARYFPRLCSQFHDSVRNEKIPRGVVYPLSGFNIALQTAQANDPPAGINLLP